MVVRILGILTCVCTLLVSGLTSSASAQSFSRFKFGVAVGTDEEIRERIEPFRLYLEEVLDRPVDLFLIPTLDELTAALVNGDVDYAVLSGSAYGAASAFCGCVEPLVSARPDVGNGRYHAVVISRRPLTMADLAGKRLAVQDSGSTTGYRIPLANLEKQGINVREHFRTLLRVETGVDGLLAVMDGRADASLGWSTLTGSPQTGYTAGTLNDYFLSGARGLDKLTVAWTSAPLPYDAHAVRVNLPDDLKTRLKDGLLQLLGQAPDVYLAIEPDLPGGFLSVKEADYDAFKATFGEDARKVLERPQP
ncbi:phosphate/phosphite/phosphonate ABC transporter binding protein [Roseibium suaedae]|uniref:Phosphate/phosphite/phosphonate ABC transporter binding protein n=1 Tax=Roseibium suaedae TaxID=735517 RepID=A0A1M7A1U6_9HYPH|nr:phosphate/phosphite/phosphonate ABC transporter binding protein [Roseibium suaedae]